MSQAQTNLTIAAPGFLGLNTERSQTDMPDGFAQVADNAVIDNYGRIAARKGFNVLVAGEGATPIGTDTPSVMYNFLAEDGTEIIFVASALKLYIADIVAGTYTDITPLTPGITADNWQILDLNNKVFFIQEGHDPIVYDHATTTTYVNTTSMPRAKCGTSAYGRLWLGNTDVDNHQVVYYSTRLNGEDFVIAEATDAGFLNISHYWPSGYDTIEALHVHNAALIIFGTDNVVVYNNCEGNPSAAPTDGGITLGDTIGGVGCIARDTVQSLGSDVLFLDGSGVRSLGRLIQEKSMPIGEISSNVRTDLRDTLLKLTAGQKYRIRALFIPEEQLYLLLSEYTPNVLAFNTSVRDEKGAMRVTRWVGTDATAAVTRNGQTLLTTSKGSSVVEYTGYLDHGVSYPFRYFTNYMSFGDSTRLKMAKKVTLTLATNTSNPYFLSTSYDYSGSNVSLVVPLQAASTFFYYGVAEFGLAEYGVKSDITRQSSNVGGRGTTLRIGIETEVDSASFSLQEINIQTLLGRLL
jgi:hypothetical protein